MCKILVIPTLRSQHISTLVPQEMHSQPDTRDAITTTQVTVFSARSVTVIVLQKAMTVCFHTSGCSSIVYVMNDTVSPFTGRMLLCEHPLKHRSSTRNYPKPNICTAHVQHEYESVKHPTLSDTPHPAMDCSWAPYKVATLFPKLLNTVQIHLQLVRPTGRHSFNITTWVILRISGNFTCAQL